MNINIGDVSAAKETVEQSMSALQFFADIIKSLAWPITALFVIHMLKDHIFSLIGKIRTLKAGDIEASFNQQIEEKSLTQASPPKIDIKYKYIDLYPSDVKANPAGAVMVAWKSIESELIRVLSDVIPKDKLRSPLAMTQLASTHSILSRSQLSKLRELRTLRNSAVHATGEEISYSAALEYVTAADEMSGALKKVEKVSTD